MSLLKIYNIYLSNKINFFVCFGLVFLVLIIYFQANPNLYTSKAVLKINDDVIQSNQGSSIADILPLGGLSTNESKQYYVREKLMSVELSTELRNIEIFEKALFAFSSYDQNEKLIIQDKKVFNSNGEWNYRNKDGSIGRPSILGFHEKFHEHFSFDYDRLTNYFTMSFAHDSEILAKDLLTLMISTINSLETEKVIEKTNKSIAYINRQYEAYPQKEVKDVLSSLIKKELNDQMFANVNQEYLLEYVDSPFIPEEPLGLKIWQKFILAILSSFLFSIFYIISLSFTRKEIKKFNKE